MTTLAALRTKLNGEIGVDNDAETLPWTIAVRNEAIADGYAELWRVGVWKAVTQDFPSDPTTRTYHLTTMREAYRVEIVDQASNIIDLAPFKVEEDGAGGNLLILAVPIAAGFTLHVRGWTAYVAAFASDAASDDLPAEYNRIPLLKSKAILFRRQSARFMRYGERTNAPPEMAISLEALLSGVAAAEREFEIEAKRLANRRPRVMATPRVFA